MNLSASQLEAVLDLIDVCHKVSSHKEIDPIWLQLKDLCEVSGLIMSVAEGSNAAQLVTHTSFVYGLPLQWMERYKTKKLVLIDPVVKMAKRKENADQIITWHEAFAKSSVKVADIAGKKFNHLDGYAIFSRSHNYTHAASMTSIAVEPKKITPAQIEMLYQLIPHIHCILEQPGFLQGPHITPRERQVLRVAAKQGAYTYDSVGEKMGITGRTAKHHFTNLREKMQVEDNAIVMEKARLMGLIK